MKRYIPDENAVPYINESLTRNKADKRKKTQHKRKGNIKKVKVSGATIRVIPQIPRKSVRIDVAFVDAVEQRAHKQVVVISTCPKHGIQVFRRRGRVNSTIPKYRFICSQCAAVKTTSKKPTEGFWRKLWDKVKKAATNLK